MKEECVFCKIVRGEEPAFVVVEDGRCMAFLSRKMSVRGHTIIIPKQHFEDIYVIPKESLAAVMLMAQRLSDHFVSTLEATGVNILHASGKSAQQSIFHFHLHLLPRFNNDGIDTWPDLPGCQESCSDLLKLLKVGDDGL